MCLKLFLPLMSSYRGMQVNVTITTKLVELALYRGLSSKTEVEPKKFSTNSFERNRYLYSEITANTD